MAEEGDRQKSGKKRKKYKDRLNSPEEKELENTSSYTDFMCPICLQLLIQPVVMPCKHELCMPCFQTHVEATSLCCPMCRVRISNWARKKAREGKLIDEERWKVIQKLFPERCKKRLDGEDDDVDGDDLPINCTTFKPILSEQGELRKEYEDELLKVELEKLEEQKASEEIIKKMMQEEKERQEKLKRDEMMAKNMQQEELKNVGDKFLSPNTKLSHFLEACKLPQEMMLRSSSSSGSSIKESSNKKKNFLTQWLSKSDEGSPGTSTESRSPTSTIRKTPVRTKQEQEDYAFAFKLQRELDKQHNNTPKRRTLEKHFYPLRQRNSNSEEKPVAKRLKTN